MSKDVVNTGFDANADEGIEIGRGDDAAFVLLFGAMLDESVDGNDEEPSGKPQQGKKNKYGGKANAVEGQQCTENGAEGVDGAFRSAMGLAAGTCENKTPFPSEVEFNVNAIDIDSTDVVPLK